jgi:hypothetical protein
LLIIARDGTPLLIWIIPSKPAAARRKQAKDPNGGGLVVCCQYHATGKIIDND